ncbi:hypothetical protein [Streptomyces sp. NPDC058579]|uniref:hypothetical protein n=1 Tax=Streptomyces sp. NPDC058579 TaxID=3346548 RepID=UPI00365A3102
MRNGDVIALMPPEPWTPSDGLPTVHRIAAITVGVIMLWCAAGRALTLRRRGSAETVVRPAPTGSESASS